MVGELSCNLDSGNVYSIYLWQDLIIKIKILIHKISFRPFVKWVAVYISPIWLVTFYSVAWIIPNWHQAINSHMLTQIDHITLHTNNIAYWENLESHNMMSSNVNIFCVTGPLWGESTSHQWIPFIKASCMELFWSVLEQTVEQTMETLVIWDAIMLIMMSLQLICWFVC